MKFLTENKKYNTQALADAISNHKINRQDLRDVIRECRIQGYLENYDWEHTDDFLELYLDNLGTVQQLKRALLAFKKGNADPRDEFMVWDGDRIKSGSIEDIVDEWADNADEIAETLVHLFEKGMLEDLEDSNDIMSYLTPTSNDIDDSEYDLIEDEE